MIGTTGTDFLKCLEEAVKWEPGQEREEKTVHKALRLFSKDFVQLLC